MTDILLPPWLDLARVVPAYLENTGVSISPFGGPPRTATLGGDRMRFTLDFTTTGGSTTTQITARGALVAFLANLRGKQNRVYATPATILRGSFPAVEILSNNTFASGTTGWSTNASLFALSVVGRSLRITHNGSAISGTTALYPTSGATVTANAAYVLRAMLRQGRGTFTARIEAGSSNTSGGYGSDTAATTMGYRWTSFTPTATTTFVNIDPVTSAGGAGQYFDVPWISASRCPLSQGSTAAFTSAMTIDSLPVSSSGLLLPGDCFEVITAYGSEFKIVTDPVDSDSSGVGYLQFSPPLRGTLSDNSPIILVQPMARCLLAGEMPQWINEPGMITSASIDLEEA